jgi:hypothetical protein
LGYKELTSPDRYFGEWNKSYINADGSYDLGEHFRVDGGVGLYYTYQPEDDDTFEFRLWQGATAFWPDIPGSVRRLVFTHRLRLEERFTNPDGWDFAMRLRYRLDTKIPINKYTVEHGAFYVPLAAEFFGHGIFQRSQQNVGWSRLRHQQELDDRLELPTTAYSLDQRGRLHEIRQCHRLHGQELVRNPRSGQGEVTAPAGRPVAGTQ